jgi:putative transposon-encoded protein
MEKKEVNFSGYAIIEKRAVNGGDSARVFVPKKWAGKKIAVVLLEDVDED